MTGVVGAELVLLKFMLDSAIGDSLTADAKLLAILFGLVMMSVPVFMVWKHDKVTKTPWLSSFILRKSGILQNLNSRQIQIYYISKLLELHDKESKFCRYCGTAFQEVSVSCANCENLFLLLCPCLSTSISTIKQLLNI